MKQIVLATCLLAVATNASASAIKDVEKSFHIITGVVAAPFAAAVDGIFEADKDTDHNFHKYDNQHNRGVHK